MNQKKVLHIFGQYLPLTMSWAYLLLKHTPGTKPYIVGLSALTHEYTDPNFVFWKNPRYSKWLKGLNRLSPTLLNLLFRKSKLYDYLIYRFCRQEQIELIHAHFGNIGADYFRLRKRLQVPFVVSFYGFDYHKKLQARPRYRKRYRQMFEQIDAVICEGPFGGQQLEKLGCPKEKIHVIHLGVESEAIPYFKRIKLPDRLNGVQIASFIGKKGHSDAVLAFAKALPKCPNLRLDLYGPPTDPIVLEEVSAQIKKLRLQDKIQIKPPVSYAGLHQLLEDYDLILQPSKHMPDGDCEGGAPIILLDAQATGMPALATEHCDIPSEVLHEKTGLLAGEGNTDQLAHYMERFYGMEQEEYDQFSLAARKHIEQNYAVAGCARQVSDLYHRLLQ